METPLDLQNPDFLFDWYIEANSKIAALEAEVEKLTSYNNARSAIFSEQQVRLARLELLLSKVNLSHHVRG